MKKGFIGRVDFPLEAFGVLGDQRRFDVRIELIQVQIGQQWPNDRSLGNSAVRGIPTPIFQVSGFEKLPDQTNEPFIMNLLPKNGEQHGMIQSFEALRDITVG